MFKAIVPLLLIFGYLMATSEVVTRSVNYSCRKI